MAEWKIERRAGTCAECERTFEDGERHASTLSIAGEELARADLCFSCWKARTGEGAGEIFWWFTRHAADARKTVQLDLETLERLFFALESCAERSVRELRYLLCLLLLRKRRLKVERIERGSEGEGESFIVKRPRRDERYRVFVFDFDAARMAELRTKLQAIFDGVDVEEGVRLAGEGGVEGVREGGEDESGVVGEVGEMGEVGEVGEVGDAPASATAEAGDESE